MSASAKFVLFLVIVVAVAASSLWLIGGKKGEYSTSLTINAAPQVVFPYLTEKEKLKQWIEGLVEVEDLEKNSDPLRKQTQRLMSDQTGKQVAYSDEVIRYVTPESGDESDEYSISVQSSSNKKVITAIYQLDVTPEGATDLKYRLRTSNTPYGRFTALFSDEKFQNRIENDARRLKDLVESKETFDPIDSPSAGLSKDDSTDDSDSN